MPYMRKVVYCPIYQIPSNLKWGDTATSMIQTIQVRMLGHVDKVIDVGIVA